jgi:hypothetical protein
MLVKTFDEPLHVVKSTAFWLQVVDVEFAGEYRIKGVLPFLFVNFITRFDLTGDDPHHAVIAYRQKLLIDGGCPYSVFSTIP